MELMETMTTECIGQPPYRFRRMISQHEIRHAVNELAERVRADYSDKNPIFMGVLNGCFIFMADLIRTVNIPCEVDFIKLSSYRDAMTSGEINLVKDIDANLEGRHIILVEDIVDTGKSLGFLRRHLMSKRPASLVMVSMFVKERDKLENVAAEYVGMIIPDEFVVGYGLDYAQQWRQLPDLYVLDKDQ